MASNHVLGLRFFPLKLAQLPDDLLVVGLGIGVVLHHSVRPLVWIAADPRGVVRSVIAVDVHLYLYRAKAVEC